MSKQAKFIFLSKALGWVLLALIFTLLILIPLLTSTLFKDYPNPRWRVGILETLIEVIPGHADGNYLA